MTAEEFRYIIDSQKEFEFSLNGINYNLTYDKDSKGNTIIVFGERYMGKRYESYGELINEAKVENHFLREVITSL